MNSRAASAVCVIDSLPVWKYLPFLNTVLCRWTPCARRIITSPPAWIFLPGSISIGLGLPHLVYPHYKLSPGMEMSPLSKHRCLCRCTPFTRRIITSPSRAWICHPCCRSRPISHLVYHLSHYKHAHDIVFHILADCTNGRACCGVASVCRHLDLCLKVVYGHFKHCVIFAIEYFWKPLDIGPRGTIRLVNHVQRQKQRCLERGDIFIEEESMGPTRCNMITLQGREIHAGEKFNAPCAWCPAAKNSVSKEDRFS